MRVLLFTGKGGVGKTTTAAATAVLAASRGRKTLVVSADAAHSLSDALGIDAGGQPQECSAGLFVQQIDAGTRKSPAWGEVRGYLNELLEVSGIDPLIADELTSLPGADELLALVELQEQADSGRWDLVVVDCAPTAETIRLLALPAVVEGLVARAFPSERFAARALRPLLGQAVGLPLPQAGVIDSVAQLRVQLQAIQRVLTAPSTSVRLVLAPEQVCVAEARRTYTALSLYGYRVDAVIANKLFPASKDPWIRRWASSQEEQMDRVRESFAPLPVFTSEFAEQEPVGEQDLRRLAVRLYGEREAFDIAPTPEPMKLRDKGDGYELEVALPLAKAKDVTLDRRSDDLVLQAGGHRRVIALPSALSRCDVIGARFHDDALTVTFERDPKQWPQREFDTGSDLAGAGND